MFSVQITHLITSLMQDLPELDIESTVLNRLAVLEVLCKNQAQTIDALQRENNRLHSCLTASTSYDPVRSGNLHQETLVAQQGAAGSHSFLRQLLHLAERQSPALYMMRRPVFLLFALAVAGMCTEVATQSRSSRQLLGRPCSDHHFSRSYCCVIQGCSIYYTSNCSSLCALTLENFS